MYIGQAHASRAFQSEFEYLALFRMGAAAVGATNGGAARSIALSCYGPVLLLALYDCCDNMPHAWNKPMLGKYMLLFAFPLYCDCVCSDVPLLFLMMSSVGRQLNLLTVYSRVCERLLGVRCSSLANGKNDSVSSRNECCGMDLLCLLQRYGLSAAKGTH